MEGGPCEGPAPNPYAGVANNSWGRLANDPRVVALLGRPATMEEGAWAYAVDDQTAVGLVNLADDAARVAAGLPSSIQPQNPGSLWNLLLGFTGFSAGVGGARATVNRYAAQLANVPESERPAALVDAILTEAQNGTLPGSAGEHGNPAYDVLRSWQKLAGGQLLAQQTGGDAAWFDFGFGAQQPDAEQGIDDAAYGRSVASVPGFTAPSSSRGAASAVGWLLVLGAVGAAGYFGWRAYQRHQLPAWAYGRRGTPTRRAPASRRTATRESGYALANPQPSPPPRGRALPRGGPTVWYHGGPELTYLDKIRWDRDRSMDQNDAGPGLYWTRDLGEASGYGRYLYRAVTRPGFRFMPARPPTMAFVRTLYEGASPERRSYFLSNWGEDATLDDAAPGYLDQRTTLDAAIMLYHDLFQHDPDAYVRAMRRIYDGARVLGSGGAHHAASARGEHLVSWSPEAMTIERVS